MMSEGFPDYYVNKSTEVKNARRRIATIGAYTSDRFQITQIW